MELHRSKDLDIVEFLNLGRSIGAVFGQGALVVAARDGMHVSRLAKRAVVIGIAYGGTSVLDLRLAPELLVNFNIGRGNGDAGIYVKYGSEGVRVNFYARESQEERGRRILQFLKGGEFPHVDLAGFGDINVYPNAVEDYVRATHKKVSFLKGYKALVDCRNSPIALLALPMFESYGMRVSLFNDSMATYQEPKPKEEFLRRFGDGGFDLGIRLLEGTTELHRPGGVVEEYEDLEALLKRLRPETPQGGQVPGVPARPP
jgi:phosphomannomutase